MLAFGRQHGLLPLLHKHLDQTLPGLLPDAVREELRSEASERVRRNLLLAGELGQLLESFDSHRILALPFKGPTLALSVYGDLSLRPFGDLDILVRSSDVPRSETLLRDRGYAPQLALSPSQEAFHRRWYYERGFVHSQHGFRVEIQWNVIPKYFAAPLPDDLWTSMRPLQLGNWKVNVMSAEHLLLLLCVHGTKHFWSELRWLVDVAELVRSSEPFDWDRVVTRARQHGCLRILLLGLALARDILEAALPNGIDAEIAKDRAIPGLIQLVRNRLFGGDDPPTLRETVTFHLRSRERPVDRIRYCLRLAMTPSIGDFTAIRLPAPLFALYYVIRPARLLTKYGRTPAP